MDAFAIYRTSKGSIKSIKGVYLVDTYTFIFKEEHFIIGLMLDGKNHTSSALLPLEQFACSTDEYFKINKHDFSEQDRSLSIQEDLFFLTKSTGSTFPLPYLSSTNPLSLRPSLQNSFTIFGSFFTPTMTVAIQGQVVDNFVFKSDNEIELTITTGAPIGMYDITMNNGNEIIFVDAFEVLDGTLFKPTVMDWTNLTGLITLGQSAHVQILGTPGSAIWNKEFDYTKDFTIRFKIAKSMHGFIELAGSYIFLDLIKVSDSSWLFETKLQDTGGFEIVKVKSIANVGLTDIAVSNIGTDEEDFDVVALLDYEYRFIAGVMYVYVDGVLKKTHTDVLAENLKLKVSVDSFDVTNIAYIEF